MMDVISLNFEGKELQSFAPAYLYMDCPIALLTFRRSSYVLSRKSLSCILRLNLKISLDWSGQSKLCNIIKIRINRKKSRLLFNVNNFNSLRISCVHFRRTWWRIILMARFCSSSTRLVWVDRHSNRKVNTIVWRSKRQRFTTSNKLQL